MPRVFVTSLLLSAVFGAVRVEAAEREALPFWPSAPSLESPDNTPNEQTKRIVADFSSADFKTRERASREVVRRGVEAFPGLARAVNDLEDPEVVARVGPLLKTRAFVVPKAMTAVTRRRLDDYEAARSRNDEAAMVRVIDSAEFLTEQGNLLIRLLDRDETNEQARQALEKKRVGGASLLARMAVADGDLDRAEKILYDGLAEGGTSADYVAMRALRQGHRFDAMKQIAAFPDIKVSKDQRELYSILCHRAVRDYASACKHAKTMTFEFHALPSILVEGGDYQGLAEVIARTRMDVPGRDNRRSSLPEALAWRLAGNSVEADKLIMAHGPKQAAGRSYDSAWLMTLLVNEKLDECLGFMIAHDDQSRAALILTYQLRLREALKMNVQFPNETSHLLVELGFKTAAQQLLMRNEPDLNSNPGMAATLATHHSAELRFAGLPKEATRYEDIVFGILKKSIMHYNEPTVFFRDYDQWMEAMFWLGCSPFRADQARFNRVRDILDGRQRADVTREQIPVYLERSRDFWNLTFAFKALSNVGETAIAFELAVAWCEHHKDPKGYTLLGDWALQHRQYKAAAAFYLKAAPIYRTDPTLMYRTGLALSFDPLTRAGGEKLMRSAEYIVLGDWWLSYSLGQTIRKFHDSKLADDYSDRHDSRFGDPIQGQWIGERIARGRKAAEARGDFAQAVVLQRQALFFPDRILLQQEPSLMANVALYQRLRALEGLQRKDFATVADALDRNLNMGPPDVELLEKALPALNKVDAAAAKRILGRAVDRLAPVVEDYPEVERYVKELARLKAIALR
jgi:hypothetical protein